MESIALFTLIVFLSIALYVIYKRLTKLTEYYNGFVTYVADEIECVDGERKEIRGLAQQLQSKLTNECLKDVEDWNNLNIKVDYLLDKKKRAEERAKAIAKIFEKLNSLLEEPKPKKTRKK